CAPGYGEGNPQAPQAQNREGDQGGEREMGAMSGLLANAKLIVVKVGSSLLVDGASGTLRREWLVTLCADVASLRRQGAKVILVSSGSIALGRNLLKLPAGVLRLEESQA